jgi:hypothetical protein
MLESSDEEEIMGRIQPEMTPDSVFQLLRTNIRTLEENLHQMREDQ